MEESIKVRFENPPDQILLNGLEVKPTFQTGEGRIQAKQVSDWTSLNKRPFAPK